MDVGKVSGSVDTKLEWTIAQQIQQELQDAEQKQRELDKAQQQQDNPSS